MISKRLPWSIATGIFLSASVASAIPSGDLRIHPRVDPIGNRSARVIHRYGKDYVVSPTCKEHTTLPKMTPFASDFRLKVFLNFDGVSLTKGKSNATTNTTNLIDTPSLDFPAMIWGRYGGRDKGIKDVLIELKLLYGDIAVEFVMERPKEGDYTMMIVGGVGNHIAGGNAVGLAPLDCKNENKNDIASVFGAKIDPTPKNLAFVIAHELGHTFGLEHVTDPTGIMAPALSSKTCCWASGPLSEPPGSCGRNGTQDSHGVLVGNVGAGEGDTIQPKIWLLRPGSGAILPGNFIFEVAAGDDLRIHHVELFFDGKSVTNLETPPFLVRITGAPNGVHSLSATAYDWKPNTISLKTQVTIDNACVKSGRCNGGVPGVGVHCVTGADCGDGICALGTDGVGVCVMGCNGKDDICPQGTTCSQGAGNGASGAASTTWACTKETESFTFDVFTAGGGGCALDASRRGGLALTFALLVVGLGGLVFTRRRRRQRR